MANETPLVRTGTLGTGAAPPGGAAGGSHPTTKVMGANPNAAPIPTNAPAANGEAAPAPAKPKPQPFVIGTLGQTNRYQKIMVYGGYGMGKTTFAGSAEEVPDLCDVLFVDAEAGGMSLIGYTGNIDAIRITSYRQLARVHEFLRVHCKYRDENNTDKLREFEAQLKSTPEQPLTAADIETPRKYRTVILDSLSELHKFAMYSLLGITVGERSLDIIPDTPEFKEWGQASEMIRLLVRSFRDLPMNVIFVCSERVDEDERKQQLRRPNLSGKLAWEVQGFLDIVGWLVTVPPSDDKSLPGRRLYLQPGRTYDAKNRFGCSVNFIEDPSMAKLLEQQRKDMRRPGQGLGTQ